MGFRFEAFQQMVFSQAWQLTVVICVVGLLTWVFARRRPHLAYALWLLVLLKAVTPPIWSSPTGAFSWASAGTPQATACSDEPVAAEAADLPQPPGQPPSPAVDTGPVDVRITSENRASGSLPNVENKSAASVTATSAGRLGTTGILGIAWLCGAAALGGLLIGRWSYYHVLLRHHRVETDPRVLDVVAELSKQLGVRRRVRVLVTTRPFGPAVGGVWRPTLILPQSLVEGESDEHVKRIIAHELIHIRRGDNLVGMLQLAAQVVWWFHPLVWWTNRRMCVEREHCCDEQVVASLRCDPGTYAQSLLDVLKLRRQLRPALLPGVDAPEVTKRRLENLMDRHKTFHRRMPGTCWVVLIAGILFIVPGARFTLSSGDARAATPAESDDGSPSVMPTEPTYEIATVADVAHLQATIDGAKPKAVITLPAGTYDQPIKINKPITLKGEDPEKCVLDVTSDEPAILIASRGPVTIEGLTIKWQRATSGRPSGPLGALATKDAKATVRNCRILAPSSSARCPAAVNCDGFSNVNLDNCRVEGFEFAVNYTGGAEGKITDCVVLNPEHCGITVFEGSKIEVSQTIVTGSRYHGLRNTGGKLLAHDNLIIENRNRGIYLGNKPASGVVRNNVIFGNGAGISAFGDADVMIVNNLLANSGAGALDSRDSCQITVKNNIFFDNPSGFVLVKEAGRNMVKFRRNAFWANKTDVQNMKLPTDAIAVDPQFKDADNGDFTPQAEEVTKNKQGLKDPKVFPKLWKKWKALCKEERTGENS